jgi:hypothetical protein
MGRFTVATLFALLFTWACDASVGIPDTLDGSTSKGGTGGTGARDGSPPGSETGGKGVAGGVSGAGGTASTGGAKGAGGTSSSGGAKGPGGTPSAGGVMGAGGATSTGGAKGAGGTTSTGGAKGAGGTPSAGGAKGAGGTPSTGGAKGAGGAAGGTSYSTNFDGTESPISENSAWHHDGLDWTVAETAGGIARGTQALGVQRSGPTQYNDSYAYLSGFPPNQTASGVVHLGTIDGSCTHEVEILLHWSDSAHDAHGYECNVAFDGSYAQIVRWEGAVGSYTYLNSGSVPGGVQDGDTVSASIVNNEITLSVNGVVRASATDSTFTTGNPGIGFWRGSTGCGTLGDYGFTSYTASSL